MKKIVLVMALILISSLTFASSTVIFPIKHQEIKPYPGNFGFVLNSATGLRNDVFYTFKCRIINPTKEEVIVKLDYNPYLTCLKIMGCGALTLNGKLSSEMLHFQPGTNDLKQTGVMTSSYNPETTVNFANYDNDYSVFVENCTAELE